MNLSRYLVYLFIIAIIVACNSPTIPPLPIQTHHPIDSPRIEIKTNSITPIYQYTQTALTIPTLTPQITPIIEITSSNLSTPTDINAQTLINKAVEDLAIRLRVSKESIQVIETNKIELPIQDWKCNPHNTEIIIPAYIIGIEIYLRVNQKIYRYIGHGKQVVFCP